MSFSPSDAGEASFSPSSDRMLCSVTSYSPSPKCARRTWPSLSIRYSAGQYWLPYAFQVPYSLSSATG